MFYHLNDYVKVLIDGFGSQLKSIILYGSKAVDEEISKGADYNLLVVLSDFEVGSVEKVSQQTLKWMMDGNPPPMIFTETEMLTSSDVFPIEFTDIKENHKLLFGRDYAAELIMKKDNLRHQCEFELKSKLLKLRQAYIISHTNDRMITLMTESISSILSIFRHVIALYGKKVPSSKKEGLEELSKLVEFDTAVFEEILAIKNSQGKIKPSDPKALLNKYLHAIDKVAKAVDKI